jgi:HPt (histidine-containing phosphotransfer) domain-containing protein
MRPEATVAPLSRDALLARVGGDAALVAAMASLFLDECPRLLADVRDAVAAQDAAALAQAAHSLKGAVSNFIAPAASQAAAQLELLGLSGDLAASAVALRTLEAELDRLVPALREMIA